MDDTRIVIYTTYVLAQLSFVALKCAGAVDWSIWVVLLPIELIVGTVVVSFLAGMAIGLSDGVKRMRR